MAYDFGTKQLYQPEHPNRESSESRVAIAVPQVGGTMFSVPTRRYLYTSKRHASFQGSSTGSSLNNSKSVLRGQICFFCLKVG